MEIGMGNPPYLSEDFSPQLSLFEILQMRNSVEGNEPSKVKRNEKFFVPERNHFTDLWGKEFPEARFLT